MKKVGKSLTCSTAGYKEIESRKTRVGNEGYDLFHEDSQGNLQPIAGCVENEIDFDIECRTDKRETTLDDAPSYVVFSSIPDLDDTANKTRDGDVAKRLKLTYAHLIILGSTRRFAVPGRFWQLQLRQLREMFPNFCSVIDDVIAPHIAMIAKHRKTHLMRPILIWGEPGIGKTAFCQAVKTILNTTMLYMDCSTMDNAGALVGSSTVWSNSTPGAIFETLAFGTAGESATSNPLICLDELDKAFDASRGNPLAPLYQLLETQTARSFSDRSIPNVIIDASKISWIACANSINSIPEPLLSRLVAYKIELPGIQQQRAIIRRIYAEIAKDLDERMSQDLADDVLDDMIELSSRQAKVMLQLAAAKALSKGKFKLEYSTLASMRQRTYAVSTSKMGFV